METKQSQKFWYILVGSGLGVIIVLLATVAGPNQLSNTTPKYKVVFFQTPTCGSSKEYGLPWAVTLGGTKIQKGGGNLPPPGYRALTGIPDPNSPELNQTIIIFSVPNGVYNYTLSPSGDFWDPVTFPQGNFSGTVRVEGSNVSVNVTIANPATCGFY